MNSPWTIAERGGPPQLVHSATGPRGLVLDLRRVGLPKDRNQLRRMPLARAVGSGTVRVADATAGWLGDSVLLAAMGLEVWAIERLPEVAALARAALRHLASDPAWVDVARRITLVEADARRWLPLEAAACGIQAVHLDPMFPPKRKQSARPPREAEVLQALAGPDADQGELVEAACRVGVRRVVWKRPRGSGPPHPMFRHAYEGTTVRYDVWIAAAETGGVLQGTTPGR